MVSPVDGPGPAPGSFLPVPTDGRSVVPDTRTQNDQDVRAGSTRSDDRGEDRRGRPVTEAVATPVGQTVSRGADSRGNPFLERGEASRRSLFSTRPASSFLAQAIDQDTFGTGTRTESAEAARRYRSVQATVDRDTARRLGPPGVDVVT